MKKYKIKIMGTEWQYFLYREEEFNKTHDDCEDSGAITLPGLKQMCFIEEYINIGTIRHEVRHAFTSELCLDSANLDLEQFEEIQCTLDECKWNEMNEVSTTIYENLVLD